MILDTNERQVRKSTLLISNLHRFVDTVTVIDIDICRFSCLDLYHDLLRWRWRWLRLHSSATHY